MPDINELTQIIANFRNARDWKQFHNPKDMALSLMLEAAEVAEHFQWKNEAEMAAYIETNRGDIAEELADVFYWTLLMAHDFKIDLPASFLKKMEQNENKYPLEKARGVHTKYNKL